ncbi:hypothetical protein D3C81_2077100 [compost metagenome]
MELHVDEEAGQEGSWLVSHCQITECAAAISPVVYPPAARHESRISIATSAAPAPVSTGSGAAAIHKPKC